VVETLKLDVCFLLTFGHIPRPDVDPNYSFDRTLDDCRDAHDARDSDAAAEK